MKTIQKLSLIALMAFFVQLSYGQEDFKRAVKGEILRIVEINRIKIEGTSGNELIIKSNGKHKQDERAAGLKPVGAAGMTDNTGLGLAVEESDAGLAIYQVTRNMHGEITVLVPNSIKLHITHSGNNGGEIKISGFSGEIEVDTRYNSIWMEDITGPALVSTIYGKIEAVFTSLANKDMSLVSNYGLIDVTLPSNSKANLKMKATHGDIFTNLELEYEKTEGMRNVRSSEMNGKLNGGGTNLNLKANYGNIYLRGK